MFQVTTPAPNRGLLEAAELRAAAGLAPGDTSQDGRLADLGLRAADAIARYCRIAGDGVNPPTLLGESCTDTFRLSAPRTSLLLSRQFVSAITAVSENGVGLGGGSYEIDKSSGILRRISSEKCVAWPRATIIVLYSAGFATPPSDLKLAAELFVRQMVSQSARDPLVRRERVDGVGETDYWVGSIDASSGSPMSADATALLAPYVSYAI